MSQTIFVIDDDNELRRVLGEFVEKLGHEAHLFAAGREALAAADTLRPDLSLIDVHLPDISGMAVLEELRARQPQRHCVIITGDFDNNLVVGARRLGAETLFKPINLEHLRIIVESVERETRERLLLQRMQEKEGIADTSHIVGDSPAMRRAKQTTAKVAASSANTVLIRGETGTGKELFARAIHFGSSRREGPFIEVNCSAIPSQLLESELFGHERGSFTDAKERKIGLLERASGGTFFLDEIGDMDFNLQAKILRVLEERAIRRVGGDRKIPVDIRLVAATHKNLDEMIAEQQFREDLYFRLNVIALELPPLREREGDVPVLAAHFLEKSCREHSRHVRGFSGEALAAMQAYHWPGNVRELRNTIERAVLIEAEDWIEAEHLHLWRRRARRESEGEAPAPRIGYDFEIPEQGFSLVEFEKVIIARAMQKARYNVSRAARLLGISRETMRYRLKKHELQAD
jgi:two-component system, NtrC family, response regulator AtoC